MDNANPTVFQPLDLEALKAERDKKRGENERDPIDALEVYEMIRNINDPEHPLTLVCGSWCFPRFPSLLLFFFFEGATESGGTWSHQGQRRCER